MSFLNSIWSKIRGNAEPEAHESQVDPFLPEPMTSSPRASIVPPELTAPPVSPAFPVLADKWVPDAHRALSWRDEAAAVYNRGRGEFASGDFEGALNRLAERKPGFLNWRESIVDFLRLLDLESSLAARRVLAKELGYPGNMNDIPKMNAWLHRQVMVTLARNGENVPSELLRHHESRDPRHRRF